MTIKLYRLGAVDTIEDVSKIKFINQTAYITTDTASETGYGQVTNGLEVTSGALSATLYWIPTTEDPEGFETITDIAHIMSANQTVYVTTNGGDTTAYPNIVNGFVLTV